jgi:hypothetical protein
MSDSVCRACFRMCFAEELDADLTCCGGERPGTIYLAFVEAGRTGMPRERAAALARELVSRARGDPDGFYFAPMVLAALRWATWREGQHDWPEGGSEEEALLFDTIRGKA